MFPSLSKCTPASLVRSTFTATKSLSISSSDSIAFYVNGSRVGSAFSVSANDVVAAEVTAPAVYSQVTFFSYTVNGSACQFAAVAQNEVNVIFQSGGAKKRWYNYTPTTDHSVSYYDDTAKGERLLGYNERVFNPLDVRSDFVVVDFSPNAFSFSTEGTVQKIKDAARESWKSYFDGNTYLRTISSPDLAFGSGDFTIEVSISLDNVGEKRSIITNYSKFERNNYYHLYITADGKIKFEIVNTAGTAIVKEELMSSAAITPVDWHHIAVCRQGASLRLFIDGILAASGTSSIQITQGLTYIGHIPYAADFSKYKGSFYGLRILKGEAAYSAPFVVPDGLMPLTATTELLIFQDDPAYELDLTAVPDPKSNTIYFYNIYGHLMDEVLLTSPPIQVEKFATATERFFVVACSDRSIHKITVSRDAYNKITLISSKDVFNLDWLFRLSFEEDIPFAGSYESVVRFKRAQAERSQPNCISAANGKIWVGGYCRIWILDKTFSLIKQISVPKLVVGIQSIGDSAVYVMSNGQVRLIDSVTEQSQTLYSGSWMGNPTIFNGFVYIADSTAKRLMKLDIMDLTKMPEYVSMGNFAPSYIAATDSKLFIAGHDTYVVKTLNTAGVVGQIEFTETVAWLASNHTHIFASHYLRQFSILRHDSDISIIPVSSPSITCGRSSVNCIPQKIRSIGLDNVTPFVPSNLISLTWYVDGEPNGKINDGCYFSIGAPIEQLGMYQVPVIIGDSAFDFMVDVVTDAGYPRNLTFDTVESVTETVRLDFTLPFNFSPCYACIDYGEVQRNFAPYTGQSKLQPGDIVSVKIPFGINANSIVSVLKMGSRIFYVPISTSSSTNSTARYYDGMHRYQRKVESFYLDTAGEYYVPYYDSTARDAYIPISFRPIVNVGGAFHPDADIDMMNDDDVTTEAFVPAANGLFDVSIDMEDNIAANAIVIYLSTPPVDINYDPNIVWVNPADKPPPLFRFLRAPANFNIKASNDGTSWTLIKQFSNLPNDLSLWKVGANEFAFTNVQPYRFWRFENTSTQNDGVAVAEIVLKASVPGTLITIDGAPLYPGKHELLDGQFLAFSMTSSPKLGDEARYVVTGPKNYELKLRTRTSGVIDYINVGSLVNPLNRSTNYFNGIQIISPQNKPVTLVAADQFMAISSNGGQAFSSSVTVPSGSFINIRKQIIWPYEKSAYLYQESIDPFFNETYYAEVGKITISQLAPEPISNGVYQELINTYLGSPILSLYEYFVDYDPSALSSVYEKANPILSNTLFNFTPIKDGVRYYITRGFIYRSLFPRNNIFPILNSIGTLNKESLSVPYDVSYGARSEKTPSYSNSDRPDPSFNGYKVYTTGTYGVMLTDPASIYASEAFGMAQYFVSNLYANAFLSTALTISNLLSAPYGTSAVEPTVVLQDRYPTIIPSVTNTLMDRFPSAKLYPTTIVNSRYDYAWLIAKLQYVGVLPYTRYKFTLALLPPHLVDVFKPNLKIITRWESRIDAIQMLKMDRFESTKVNVNYDVIEKFQFIDALPLVFLYNDDDFYGFFNTQQEASVAAVNAGHFPFAVYQVPGSMKYSYRRIFTIGSDCTIFPGPRTARERLIQGG